MAMAIPTVGVWLARDLREPHAPLQVVQVERYPVNGRPNSPLRTWVRQFGVEEFDVLDAELKDDYGVVPWEFLRHIDIPELESQP